MHRLILSLCAAIVVGTLLAAPVAAQLPPPPKPATPYRDEKLGLVFPIDANFVRSDPHQFPAPGAGYGINYEFELPDGVTPNPKTPQGTRVTITVYNNGLAAIPSGPDSKEVEEQFARAIVALQKQGRAVAEHAPADQIALGSRADALQFRRQPFAVTTKEGKAAISTIYLTAHANHFIKIRVTIPKRIVETGDVEVARLLAAFAESLK